MSLPDPRIFLDVASIFKINYAAIIEKDYKVIEIDVEQFAHQHPEFANNPKAELKLGLQTLKGNPIHKERYHRFIGPLVHHPSPADWDTAFKTLEELATNAI